MTLFELKQLFETKQAELTANDFDKWVDEFWTKREHNANTQKSKLVIKDLKRNKEIELIYNKGKNIYKAISEV